MLTLNIKVVTYRYNNSGNQRVKAGRIINNASLIISAHQNGVTPRNTVALLRSFTMPVKTNTFMPTGGVIKLISVATTTIIPNQIGSIPKL